MDGSIIGDWMGPRDFETYRNSEASCVKFFRTFITAENINGLFELNEVPPVFDLLTIDMDRNDYYIMKALDIQKFKPRVVTIEFSTFFLADESCVVPYNGNKTWQSGDVNGASLSMISRMMRVKGYSFVAVTVEHAIFVHSSELDGKDLAVQIPDTPWHWQRAIRLEQGFKPMARRMELICVDNNGAIP